MTREEFCALTHGAAHRSPIQLASFITGVQRTFIAQWMHPRPTTWPRTLARAHRLRHDRVRRAPTRTPTNRRCRAQCGSSTAAIFHHPDRPHDLVFNDPRDRLPITPLPDRLTISSTTVHAHTRAHLRSHARHGLARAQPSVLDARTRTGHTRLPHAQSTRSAHTHHALARTHAARHEHTHTPIAMIKSR